MKIISQKLELLIVAAIGIVVVAVAFTAEHTTLAEDVPAAPAGSGASSYQALEFSYNRATLFSPNPNLMPSDVSKVILQAYHNPRGGESDVGPQVVYNFLTNEHRDRNPEYEDIIAHFGSREFEPLTLPAWLVTLPQEQNGGGSEVSRHYVAYNGDGVASTYRLDFRQDPETDCWMLRDFRLVMQEQMGPDWEETLLQRREAMFAPAEE